MSLDPDIRWKQRFQNFDRAFVLLREAMEKGPGALNPLEKEGVIQRFEVCFELAWITVRDYMEADGVVFVKRTPRPVLKDAFAAKVLGDGQVWIDMLDHRNLLSHTYDRANFENAVDAIHRTYLAAIDRLHDFLRRGIHGMKTPPLSAAEMGMVQAVFRRHPEVASATMFGSRAKGVHSPRSDVDLAVAGDVTALRAEAIAAELEELPLPYRFEVQPFDHIHYRPLREHIERVGILIYER